MRRNSWLTVIIYAVVAAVCTGLDQLTKFLCVKKIDLEEVVEVIPGVLNFNHIRNTGAAFGSFSDSRWLFMLGSTVLLLFLTFYVISNRSKLGWFTAAVLGGLAGGGIGNMIDRIANGYVVDFIDVICIPGWVWIFNVADCFVCVCGFLMVIIYLKNEHEKQKKKKATEKAEVE